MKLTDLRESLKMKKRTSWQDRETILHVLFVETSGARSTRCGIVSDLPERVAEWGDFTGPPWEPRRCRECFARECLAQGFDPDIFWVKRHLDSPLVPEDRVAKVLDEMVSMRVDSCPECGDVFCAGGCRT